MSTSDSELHIDSTIAPTFSKHALGTSWDATDASYPLKDYNFRDRHLRLAEEVKKRASDRETDGRTSCAAYLIETAADRHFQLLAYERRAIAKMFTEWELQTILNTNCGAPWDWYPGMTLATAVADDNGIESWADAENFPALRDLIEKLQTLTLSQDAALADACEQFWSGCLNTGESLSQMMLHAGLELRS